jgi:hypothetical protein
MSETQALLGKIAALRQRLEQATRLVTEAGASAAALAEGRAPRLRLLERQAAVGDEHDARVDRAVRVLTGPRADEARGLPRQLTLRARRVLERGRGLLGRLREMSAAFSAADDDDGAAAPLFGRDEPLAGLYRDTAAVTDTALRVVPLLPEAASAQLHLCEGLEAALAAVADRVRLLAAGVEARRAEARRVDRLANLLAALADERPADVQSLRELAEEVVADAEDGGPLRFLAGDAARPAHFAACHGLTTARVVARVVRHDPELRGRTDEAVLAALVHDAGMAAVPADVLTHSGAPDLEQRRLIEAHCHAGAAMAARLLPDAPWLARAAAEHHERLDGSGYPDGLRAHQVGPLSRLLAVCDVYAAACVTRPHRPARDTRTALTDALLLAEQGLLDRDGAERLLHLSFYPVGTAVELADGALGVVTATPAARCDLNRPARPVVALFTDGQGEALPAPRPLDLGQVEGRAVVRSLPAGERLALLGARWPEWA